MFPEKPVLKLKNKDLQAYLDSLSKGSDFCDLIYFKDEDVLAGSFDRHYGLFTVKDRSDDKTLKSIIEVCADYKNYLYSSIYSFPHQVQEYVKTIIPIDYISSYEIAKHREQGSLINIKNTQNLPDWVSFDNWKKCQCSPGNLDPEELIQVIQYIHTFKNSDEIFEKYYDKVKKQYQSFINESNEITCIERPISISIHGTDDCSYGRSVESLEDAKMIYDILKNKGKTDNFYELIKSLGFVFTN